MTRLLVLFRHAKADQPNGVADFDRPLSDRGARDSLAAGAWLLSQGYAPDLVICSAARRARQTWKHAASGLGGSPRVDYRREVYAARDPDDLLELIRGAPPATGILAVIGHNPCVEMLCAALDPGGGVTGGIRTAGIAVHALDGEWAALKAGGAPVVVSTTPRAGSQA